MKKSIFTKQLPIQASPRVLGKQAIVLLLSIAFYCNGLMAQAQCTPDVSYTFTGYYPDSLPIALVLTPYLGVIDVRTPPKDTTITIPPNPPVPVTIDSIVIDNLAGLPLGFSYACSAPNCVFLAATNECIAITGTADTSQKGIYPLKLYITAYVKVFGSPVLYPDSITQFVLKVCKNDSCLNLDTIIIVDTVGIKIVASNNNIKIYPNPFKTFAYINFPNDRVNKNIRFILYDVLGRKVKSIDAIQSQQLKISRDNLTGGMYIYKIIADDHITIQTGKLFIQ